MHQATRVRIKVGDRVAIAFPSPPDEWGIVEVIYPPSTTHRARALVRYQDGTGGTTVAMDRLRLLDAS